MKLNEWKNKEMFQRLTEAYGYGKMEEEEEVIDESNCMGEGELGESNCMEEGMCPRCGMNPCGCPMMEEGSKPDFLDLDKDGDKEEPMKDAAKDAKGDSKDKKEEKSEKKLDEAKIRTLVREALKRAFKK